MERSPMVYSIRFKQLPLSILAITFVKAFGVYLMSSISPLISWMYQVSGTEMVSLGGGASAY